MYLLRLQPLPRVKCEDINESSRAQVTVLWDRADQYWPLIWRPWASCHLFYEYGRALWDLSSWEEGSIIIHPRWLRDLTMTSYTSKTCTDWPPPMPSSFHEAGLSERTLSWGGDWKEIRLKWKRGRDNSTLSWEDMDAGSRLWPTQPKRNCIGSLEKGGSPYTVKTASTQSPAECPLIGLKVTCPVGLP